MKTDEHNFKKCNESFFTSFKPGNLQEGYLEPEEVMVFFALILHANAFSKKNGM